MCDKRTRYAISKAHSGHKINLVQTVAIFAYPY